MQLTSKVYNKFKACDLEFSVCLKSQIFEVMVCFCSPASEPSTAQQAGQAGPGFPRRPKDARGAQALLAAGARPPREEQRAQALQRWFMELTYTAPCCKQQLLNRRAAVQYSLL